MVLKTKKGFTLIEMVVVMSIIAILSLIGVGALIAAQNSSAADAAAEELINTFREAKNRSISIYTNPKETEIPKGWIAQVDSVSKSIDLKYVNANSSGSSRTVLSDSKPSESLVSKNVTYKIELDNGSSPMPVVESVAIFNMTPFGKTYLFAGTSSRVSSCMLKQTIDVCNIYPSGMTTEDFYVAKGPGAGGGNNENPYLIHGLSNNTSSWRIKITVSSRNQSSVVYVNSRGDAYKD